MRVMTGRCEGQPAQTARHDCIPLRYSTTGCWGAVLFTMHGDMLGITLWSAVKNWPWGASSAQSIEQRIGWLCETLAVDIAVRAPQFEPHWAAGRCAAPTGSPRATSPRGSRGQRPPPTRGTPPQIVGRRYRPRQLSQVRLTPPLTHEDANSLERVAHSQPVNGRSFRRAVDISRRRGRRAR